MNRHEIVIIAKMTFAANTVKSEALVFSPGSWVTKTKEYGITKLTGTGMARLGGEKGSSPHTAASAATAPETPPLATLFGRLDWCSKSDPANQKV